MNALAECFLALGTNLGNRGAHLRRALDALREIVRINEVSRIYESEPVGLLDQPDYWNLVLRAHSERAPAALLRALKELEVDLGRVPAPRNAPRIIDIDLLSVDQLVMHSPEIDLPHPRMHERTFVLYPLAEIAPAFRHPESGLSVNELISRIAHPARAVPLAHDVINGGA